MSRDVVTVIERAKIDAINREHALCEQAYSDALLHGIECGRMLAAVKADLAHGDWGPWLAEHFDGSERTARVYMQLANAPDLDTGRASADMPASIAAALKQISTPRPRTASPRDAVGMVGGLEDDDEATASPASVVVRDIDQARDRIRGEAPSPWTEQHSRRRNRIVVQLDEARRLLEDASQPGLVAYAIAEMLRSAEVAAHQAQAQLGDLAFGFER